MPRPFVRPTTPHRSARTAARWICALPLALAIVGCSTTEPDPATAPAATPASATPVTASASTTPATTAPVPFEAFRTAADEASGGFVCEFGGPSTALVALDPDELWADRTWTSSVALVRFEDGSSYFRSFDDLSSAAEPTGLELLTVDGVSYARFTGAPGDDASRARRDLVTRLDGAWASWGQPDTISLEGMPPTPTGCFEWSTIPFDTMLPGVVDETGVVYQPSPAPGTAADSASLPVCRWVGGPSTTNPIVFTCDLDDLNVLRIVVGATPDMVVPPAPAPGALRAPAPLVTVSQDEFNVLVGG